MPSLSRNLLYILFVQGSLECADYGMPQARGRSARENRIRASGPRRLQCACRPARDFSKARAQQRRGAPEENSAAHEMSKRELAALKAAKASADASDRPEGRSLRDRTSLGSAASEQAAADAEMEELDSASRRSSTKGGRAAGKTSRAAGGAQRRSSAGGSSVASGRRSSASSRGSVGSKRGRASTGSAVPNYGGDDDDEEEEDAQGDDDDDDDDAVGSAEAPARSAASSRRGDTRRGSTTGRGSTGRGSTALGELEDDEIQPHALEDCIDLVSTDQQASAAPRTAHASGCGPDRSAGSERCDAARTRSGVPTPRNPLTP